MTRLAVVAAALLLVVGAAAGSARAEDAAQPPATASAAAAPDTEAAPAAAAPATPSAPAPASAPVQSLDRPWAKGVSPERQAAALARLQEGNALLKESLFLAAARKYREALTEWDHPGIHYNLALALLNVDQPVEVYQQLESAIQYGPGPLEPEKLEHAKGYLKLIEKQVAPVDVRCDVAGAEVSLDGQPVFRAPGRYQSLVRAGVHTVMASKDGYTPTVRTETLVSGRPTTLQLKLYTSGELIDYRRRWPLWRPVAVTVLGGLLLATGAVMTFEARDRFKSYDDQVRAQCAMGGCPAASPFADLKDQGNTFQRAAVIAYSVGGAMVATGVLLLIVDRSVPYRVDPEGERQDVASRGRTRVEPVLSPVLGPRLAGVVGTVRF